ncbi:MAG: hypothetical protein LC802_02175 [Acidobacteria bacterium]|nr:hypothetical protein [Acidobacteriota bacterium]
MRFSISKKAAALVAGLVLMALSTGGASTARRVLPNPVLVFMGPEYVEISGKQWTRYRYAVDNSAAYPNELFAASPDLPPCGANTKASRTWVDIYDQTGKRLNGFCALGNHDGLGKLWFAMERDVIPPSWIYIELNDRKTATKYKSSLAETTD